LNFRLCNTPFNSTLSNCATPNLVQHAIDLLLSITVASSQEEISNFLVEFVSADESSDESGSEEATRVRSKKRPLKSSGTESTSVSSMKMSLKAHKKAFSDAWITLLKLPLQQDAYKSVLLNLPEKVIPHLVNPLILSDFLTDSYNVGGVVSLLVRSNQCLLILLSNIFLVSPPHRH
jgi:hypothetical protein